ncbi:unnamed protein product [Lampetra planeri]
MSQCADVTEDNSVLLYLLPLGLLALVIAGTVALLGAVLALPGLRTTPRHLLFANLVGAELMDMSFTASVAAFDGWSIVQEMFAARQMVQQQQQQAAEAAVVPPVPPNGTWYDLRPEAELANSTAWWPGLVACLSGQVLAVTLHTGAVSALACISLDRYVTVRHPLRYLSLCSPERVCWCLLATWLSLLMLACGLRIPSEQHQSAGCEMLILVSHEKLLNIFWLCFMSAEAAVISVLLHGVWREGALLAKGGGSMARARVTVALNALHVAVYVLPTPVHNAVRLLLVHEEGGGGEPQVSPEQQDLCPGTSNQAEVRTHLLIVTLVHLAQGATLLASGLRKPDIQALFQRALHKRVAPHPKAQI